MSMTVREVRAWLSSLDDDDKVGIGEDGMTLRPVHEQESYLEVGCAREEQR